MSKNKELFKDVMEIGRSCFGLLFATEGWGNISERENAKVSPSMPMLETLADGFKATISELTKGV